LASWATKKTLKSISDISVAGKIIRIQKSRQHWDRMIHNTIRVRRLIRNTS
jgi:hypothetical protein